MFGTIEPYWGWWYMAVWFGCIGPVMTGIIGVNIMGWPIIGDPYMATVGTGAIGIGYMPIAIVLCLALRDGLSECRPCDRDVAGSEGAGERVRCSLLPVLLPVSLAAASAWASSRALVANVAEEARARGLRDVWSLALSAVIAMLDARCCAAGRLSF